LVAYPSLVGIYMKWLIKSCSVHR